MLIFNHLLAFTSIAIVLFFSPGSHQVTTHTTVKTSMLPPKSTISGGGSTSNTTEEDIVDDDWDDFKDHEDRRVCEDANIERAFDACYNEETEALNKAENLQERCEIHFNKTLCTIEAVCDECNFWYASEYEERRTEAWIDENPNCSQWYPGYKYRSTRVCTGSLGMRTLAVVLVFTIPSFLCILVVIGVYCYCFKEGETSSSKMMAMVGGASEKSTKGTYGLAGGGGVKSVKSKSASAGPKSKMVAKSGV